MTRSDDGRSVRVFILVATFVVIAAAGGARATSCGFGTYPFPYTDVAGVGDAFCPGIMEAYVLGVTKGTTATTFSPNDNVPTLADDDVPAALDRSVLATQQPTSCARAMVDTEDCRRVAENRPDRSGSGRILQSRR